MNYQVPNHILDIVMPIAKAQKISPIKLIEEAIKAQYEDNVCQKTSVRKQEAQNG